MPVCRFGYGDMALARILLGLALVDEVRRWPGLVGGYGLLRLRDWLGG